MFHAHHAPRSIWVEPREISLRTGGTVNFEIIAGSQHGRDRYVLLASATGTSGATIGGVDLPLAVDGLFLTSLTAPNLVPWSASLGTLDLAGRATASFSLPPRLPSALDGIEIHHAALLLSPFSNLPTGATSVATIELTDN